MAMTQDERLLLDAVADSVPAVQAQARARWSSGESYQSRVVSKYRKLHHYYNPFDGDHWPEDKSLRPGKIHTTSNLCKMAVDVDARLQSIPPRFTIPVATLGPEQRKRAEGAEALLLQWLDLSGFEVWAHTLCQVKSMYGKGILKPYWDDRLKRGDVSVVENPANLRLGWGSSDYTRIDWALYQYALSHIEVMNRWPGVRIEGQGTQVPHLYLDGGDHNDPLNQRDDDFRAFYREHSDYERTQVNVWDYWYKKSDDKVCNAILINGIIIDGPHEHDELADIPYIVIEQDHEPGSPEGVSTIEPILDLQDEFNRLLSHGLQHIADDVDPAWYLSGPSADTVPVGIVPKAGEVTGVGENVPGAWPKSVNTFPINEMMQELWNEFHRLTGLPEILFGQTPGADTSGRAIAIQVEAASNRLDPRRRRLYNGLKELLVFWTIMAEKKNPQISVGTDPETGAERTAGVGDLVKGFYSWKIIAPEITPRDSAEVTQNEINKINAKLSSLRSSMNQIGVEAPEAELAIIAQEQSNVSLNPAAVQAQVSVQTIVAQLEQLRMQNAQMAQQLGQLTSGAPTPPGSILDSNAGQAALAQQQAQAQPTAFEDQNQPMTQAGTPPPQGAPGPGGPAQLTALTRQGEALQQIGFNAFGGQSG
jgi:hypothetical protein